MFLVTTLCKESKEQVGCVNSEICVFLAGFFFFFLNFSCSAEGEITGSCQVVPSQAIHSQHPFCNSEVWVCLEEFPLRNKTGCLAFRKGFQGTFTWFRGIQSEICVNYGKEAWDSGCLNSNPWSLRHSTFSKGENRPSCSGFYWSQALQSDSLTGSSCEALAGRFTGCLICSSWCHSEAIQWK